MKQIEVERTVQHGTYSAYTNNRCLCDACRKAGREYRQSKRIEVQELKARVEYLERMLAVYENREYRRA